MMKTKLLVVGLLLCCLMVGLGARFQPEENKKWEYRIETVLTGDYANKLAGEGWELVTASAWVVHGSVGHEYIFRRERK